MQRFIFDEDIAYHEQSDKIAGHRLVSDLAQPERILWERKSHFRFFATLLIAGFVIEYSLANGIFEKVDNQ